MRRRAEGGIGGEVSGVMPVLPRPHQLPLHDAIKYIAERCNCTPEEAGKTVHDALARGELVASANVLVRHRAAEPAEATGIDQVPWELWAETPWQDFLRRAVMPFGNPMFKGQPRTPVYSHPRIATADIDAWLDRNDLSRKVPASQAAQEKGLSKTIYEALQIKPGAFGFAVDLKPIVERFWRRLRFR